MIYPEDAPRLGQEYIAAKLSCDDMFLDNGIEAIYARKGNLLQETAIRLGLIAGNSAGKVGLCVVVDEPSFKLENQGMIIPRTKIVYTIQILQNNKFNYDLAKGIGIEASTLARRTTNILHNFAAPSAFTILLADEFPFQHDPDLEMAGIVDIAYKGKFEADELSASSDVVHVANVQYSLAGLLMSLSCSTVGANIYYTKDGSFPGSVISTATLYTGPFTVISGQTINIAGFKHGMLSSDITTVIV